MCTSDKSAVFSGENVIPRGYFYESNFDCHNILSATGI